MSWKDQARKRAKQIKQGATFKLQEGETTFRILPNKKGPDYAPYIEFRVHRDVGPDNAFVRCGKKISGEGDCWLCDVKIPELEKSGSSQKRAQAAKIASKEQFLVQVSHVDDGEFQPAKPWWVSTGGARSMRSKIMSLLSSTKRNYEDPVKGYNLTIERTGSGKNDTVYGPPMADEDPSEVPKKILDTMKLLSEYLPKYSKEEQESAYFGKEKDEEDSGRGKRRRSDDDEDATQTRSGKNSGKKKADDDDEDSTAEDEESVEEESVEEEEAEEVEEETEETETEESEEEAEEEPEPEEDESELEDEPEPDPDEPEEPEEEKPKATKKTAPKPAAKKAAAKKATGKRK